MKTAASRGRIKGSGIGEFVAWYLRDVDGPRLRAVVAAMPAELRAYLDVEHPRLGLLPSQWYPVEVIHALLDGVLAGMTSAEIEKLLHDASVATVAGMRRGVYRILFSWVLTPERLGSLVQTAFERNYEQGSLESVVLGPRRHRGIVRGWAGHHPFLCRHNASVKAEIYRAMGCRDVRIERRFCIEDGDDSCGSIIAWGA